MLKVGYKLSVGRWSIDSSADPRTELVDLDVLHELSSPAGHCRVTAYSAGGSLGAIAPGDEMTVELTAGSVSATVATATVQSVDASLERVALVGRTGMQQLAETRVNQVYENQSLGQVVRDLAGQAEVDTGDVEAGSRHPYLVVHESRSVARAVLELARREGMDVWFDPDGKLTVKKFTKARADHAFRYGMEVLALSVRTGEPVAAKVLVHGESPSSSSGSDTWHWLVSDLGSYRGESGSGVRMRTVQDGAIRTKAAADTAAEARLTAIRAHATTGRLTILGRPTVRLGDAIEIRDVPDGAVEGVLKVTSVRHVVNRGEGYVTTVGFSAPGGDALGGLL